MKKGIIALPVAGLLYLGGGLLRGAYVLPTPTTATAFAQWATRPLCTIGYAVLICAAVCSIFGYFALASRLASSLSSTAAVLSIVGVAFLVALFGSTITMLPALGQAALDGNASALAIAEHSLSNTTLRVIGGMISLNIFGHLLFAVSMWRTDGMPKVAAPLFVIAPIGMCMPFVYPIELTGFVLYLVSTIMIARAVSVSESR